MHNVVARARPNGIADVRGSDDALRGPGDARHVLGDTVEQLEKDLAQGANTAIAFTHNRAAVDEPTQSRSGDELVEFLLNRWHSVRSGFQEDPRRRSL